MDHTSDSSEQSEHNQPWNIGALYHVAGNRLYFSVHPTEEYTINAIQNQKRHYFFTSFTPGKYEPFCLDFGPTNVSSLVRFSREIRETFTNPKLNHRPLVYYCMNCPKEITNTAMSLATYLMLEHGYTPQNAISPFTCLTPSPLVGFRDASMIEPPSYLLDVLSCLRGLQRAISQCYLSSTPEKFLDEFDVYTWDMLECPHVLNVNQVSPKFIASFGPVSKPREMMDEHEHAPEEYISAFHQRGVKTIIRINEASSYDRSVFIQAGFDHQQLNIESPLPSFDAIERFLDICDSTDGAVAVHCRSGLGRTGTLIAMYLIKNEGFSSREALGYLRIVRPGSVIGPQQHFLEAVERATWNGNCMLPHEMDTEIVNTVAGA